MALEDFNECARATFGDIVDMWDEAVVEPLIDLAQWFAEQSSSVQAIFTEVIGAAGSAAITWLAALVGATAAEVVIAILAAFAAGVGIGSGLIIVAECASRY